MSVGVKTMEKEMLNLASVQGLPWEAWINAFCESSHLEDKPPNLPPEYKDINRVSVMKLPKEDMGMYGLCPRTDVMSLVVCEICNKSIKPQALRHHIDKRHSKKEGESTILDEPLSMSEKPSQTVIKTMLPRIKNENNNEASKIKHVQLIASQAPLVSSVKSANPSLDKDDMLHPIVAYSPLAAAIGPTPPTAASLTKPLFAVPSVVKPRRQPRKQAPVKERVYDPDKHCGVLIADTLKPCTWSLTCKSHTIGMRRSVSGRSKPFDQLLFDHRKANEAMASKRKKTSEPQNTFPIFIIPYNKKVPEPKRLVEIRPKPIIIRQAPIVQRLPELKLEMTAPKKMYLSIGEMNPKEPDTSSSFIQPSSIQLNPVSFKVHHPKSLGVPNMFSRHKIGGSMHLKKQMSITRQVLEKCVKSTNGFSHKKSTQSTVAMSASFTSVLKTVNSQDNKSVSLKFDKPKNFKKVTIRKDACIDSSKDLFSTPLNEFKSVLARQYPNSVNHLSMHSTNNSQFHIPDLFNNNILKRPSDMTPKCIPNKKFKTSPKIYTVFPSNQPNSLISAKPPGSYVRVAIANGNIKNDPKNLSLCDTPKFINGSKILNQNDLREMGVIYEIYE